MSDFQGFGRKRSYFISSYCRIHLEECGFWAFDNQLRVFCFYLCCRTRRKAS